MQQLIHRRVPTIIILFPFNQIHPIAGGGEPPSPEQQLSVKLTIGGFMAGRILAQLIVMGSGILGRAVIQAYRKALENANKTGVAHEVVKNIHKTGKTMTEQEARQILGITENASWEEVVQKYDDLFERNSKSGSFYLQSKVHRAKECLESIYQRKDQGGIDAP